MRSFLADLYWAPAVALQQHLHTDEGRLVDDRVVLSWVRPALVLDLAEVDAVADDRPHRSRVVRPPRHRRDVLLAVALLPMALLVEPACHLGRAGHLDVAGEDLNNECRLVRVHVEVPIPDADVPKRDPAPAEESALGPPPHCLSRACGRLLALPLGQQEHETGDHPSRRSRSVDALIEDDDADAQFLDLLRQEQEVAQRTRETIKSRHRDRVELARPHVVQHPLHLGPLQRLPGHAFLPIHDDLGRIEMVRRVALKTILLGRQGPLFLLAWMSVETRV